MQSPGGSKKVQATADPIKVKADTVRAAVQAMLLTGKSASSGTASALSPGNTINGVLFTGASPITITASAPHPLSFGTHITPASGSYDGSSVVTIATDATNLNTASTIVARDGSGNFSVGAITHAGTDVFSNANPFSVANGQTLTFSVTAQTVGAATLTIPNFASVSDTFAFVTLAQTLANKTLASSCSVPASTLTGNLAYAALPTGSGSWDAGSGNTTTITRALTVSAQLTANGGFQTNVSASDRWDNTLTQSIFHTFATGSSAGPRYMLRSARGTIASPTATRNGDILGGYEAAGYDGANYIDGGISMLAFATEDFAVGSNGTRIVFRTTPTGSATALIAMTIGSDQSVACGGLVRCTANAAFGPNVAIGPNGVVISSSVALRVASSATASSGVAVVLDAPTTLVAAANNDTLIGIRTTQSYTPGSFTGVAIIAFQTAAISTATFTSPSDPRGVVIGAVTGSGITANAVNAVILDLGVASGATNNYSVRSASWNVLQSGAATFASVGLTGLVTKVNNVATAGFGVSTIYGAGSVVAKANATSGTVATYTPAADGTFIVYAEVTVTASTTFSFTVTCTYTDDGGTARTQTFSFVQAGGTGAPVQTLTNTLGVGAYAGNPQTIRAKGANAITIQTATGGTFTTVTYSIRAAIIQLSA